MTIEDELQDYKNTCDFLIKSSCEDQREIVILKEALQEVLAVLQDCIGDLEYEESDGWMSGQVCVDCCKCLLGRGLPDRLYPTPPETSMRTPLSFIDAITGQIRLLTSLHVAARVQRKFSGSCINTLLL